MWVVEGVSVAVDQWWGSSADPASTVVSGSVVVPFLVLAAIGVVPVVALLRGMRPLELDRRDVRPG